MTAFHAAFAEALDGRVDALWPATSGDDRAVAGLAVYRNTTAKGRIDALQANYPTIARMTGDDWFRAAARAFVAEAPGDDPAMAGYGESFPDWLKRFAPARDLPYLPPVARLDRAWTEAHLAPDAEPLAPDQAARLGLALAGVVVSLHPSVRLFRFDWSAPSLWLAHRYPEIGGELEWRRAVEGLIVWRPRMAVTARRISPAEHAFLQACGLGRPLGAAAAAAGVAAAGVDVSALFGTLIQAGVFAPPASGSRP